MILGRGIIAEFHRNTQNCLFLPTTEKMLLLLGYI